MKRREFLTRVVGSSSAAAAAAMIGRGAFAQQGLAPYSGPASSSAAGSSGATPQTVEVSLFHATFGWAKKTRLTTGSKFNLGFPDGVSSGTPSGNDHGLIVVTEGAPHIKDDEIGCIGRRRLVLPGASQIIALPVLNDHSAAHAMTGGYIDNSCYIGGSPATPAPRPTALSFSIVTQQGQGHNVVHRFIGLFRWRLNGSIEYNVGHAWVNIGSYLNQPAPWIHFRAHSSFDSQGGHSALTLERIEFFGYAANGDCASLTSIGVATPSTQTLGGDESVIGAAIRVDHGEVVVDEFVHVQVATATASASVFS